MTTLEISIQALREVTKIEHRVSMNSLKNKFRTYIDIRKRKQLKGISKRMSKAALRVVSFWDKVMLIYYVKHRVEFEVNPHTHTRQGDWIL